MALRDQPYIPLYVQDFLTDEKLIECSAEATGVYIRLLCIMHKSDEYGTILLRQRDKLTKNVCHNFAYKLSKQMPYNVEIIKSSLKELIDEGAIRWELDKLLQKRMIHDNSLSIKRSNAGQKGGFATANRPAKEVANTEYEYESENVNKKDIIKRFEEVWSEYPNKDGKRAALKHFQATVKTEQDFDNIKTALKNYLGCRKVRAGYIKNGSTWFNNWKDWVNFVETKEPESDKKREPPVCQRGHQPYVEPDYMKTK